MTQHAEVADTAPAQADVQGGCDGVRLATVSDVSAILLMGQQFYESTYYAGIAPFCAASAEEMVRTVLANGVVVLAGPHGAPQGMLGLAILPFSFNHAIKVAYETFWWVEPAARGGRDALRMLRAAERECTNRGASAIQMAALELTSPESTASLYERLGYSRSESFFTKKIRGV